VQFWLGTHETGWLARAGVPLFVSHRRLRRRRTLPRAVAPWALDSGGFTELDTAGRWTVTEAEYVDAVSRYAAEVGKMEWAAPQDWMCEPHILARTGLSVEEHQARTVANFCRLRQAAPDLPWVPVLQGWAVADYVACVGRYEAAGVDLAAEPLVGVGSVCRRQGTREANAIVGEMAARGLRLHGFGVKVDGLARYGTDLASADSMAWSYAGRRRPDPSHHHGRSGEGSCANCLRYALGWRRRVVADLDAPHQGRFELACL
jgi:hypothetical protein